MHVYVDFNGEKWYRSRDCVRFLGFDNKPAFIKTRDWRYVSPENPNCYLCIFDFIDDENLSILLEHSTKTWVCEFRKWYRDNDVSTHFNYENLSTQEEDDLEDWPKVEIFNGERTGPVN